MMGTQLDATLFTVEDLFSEAGAHYEIPIYQRNYSWRNEQIDQLIDDVWTAAQDDTVAEYFLGNLIVAPKPASPETKNVTYEVVDGQQRLTTLFMLLSRLDVGTKAKLIYASRRSATDALARISDSEDDEGSGILTGYKIIDARIRRFSVDQRNTFKTFLVEGVQLVRAALPDDTDLNKYFEIMNTRGQQLEQVDIVKARLMSYLRSDAGDVDEKRACFAWIWDACADMDSYIQMALARGSTELREAIFGAEWDLLKVRSFTELASLRPDADNQVAVRSEGLVLRDALRVYAQAPEPPLDDEDEAGRFESTIRFPNLLLHALKVMRTAGIDDLEVDGHLDDSKLIKQFGDEFRSLTEFERSVKAEQFAETLLSCKFILDNYVLKREFTATNGEDGAWSLKRLTRGESVSRHARRAKVNARFPPAFAQSQDEADGGPSDDATRDVLLLQSLLRVTYTSPRTMHWITRVLSAGVLETSRVEGAQIIVRELRAYIRLKVSHGLPGQGGPTGFKIERIVYTYLDYLLAQGASPQLQKDPAFAFVFRTSVEHFFPQHANRDDLGWDAVLPDHPELNMFGNLALVSVSANSKFSNALPRHKADKTEVIRQSKKLELMATTVRTAGEWTRDSIRQHDSEMVEILRSDLVGAGILS
ncbi:DUF262 domain-containing protein [Aeromicrobium sp. A1-2]|uniref:DUF262 domain-containing protein n=1 Tax=Aeromicrobium sp. A1-2 TaxID=2107713 RepID=UPI000E53F967|nr:DUF262 domain-containing protein [Aeromicrobium sp. A1-2]AXT85097.1 DUF262 domain-containing protein [Aeromicrobium sp. A1-2]